MQEALEKRREKLKWLHRGDLSYMFFSSCPWLHKWCFHNTDRPTWPVASLLVIYCCCDAPQMRKLLQFLASQHTQMRYLALLLSTAVPWNSMIARLVCITTTRHIHTSFFLIPNLFIRPVPCLPRALYKIVLEEVRIRRWWFTYSRFLLNQDDERNDADM